MSAGGLLQPRLGRLRDAMAGYVERGDLPGLVWLVSRRGAVYSDFAGTMAAGGGAAIGLDTIFRISSMTKPVTATAAMILVEEAKLRLDEPVDRLLPELANRQVLKRLDGPLDETVPANRPITLRDLLTFTMGFGLVFASPDTHPILRAVEDLQLGQGIPAPDGAPEPDEWIRRLGTLPLMAQPGERWMYNTSADVLGVLIARAAGQPLEAFMRERIFEPLSMKDTSFSVPAEKLDRLPPEYWTNYMTGATEVYDEPAGQWSHAPAFPFAAGGLVSTVDDYLAFAQMLLDNGRASGGRILSRPSVELMTSDHLTPAQKGPSLVEGFWDSHGWGYCMSVTTSRASLEDTPGRYGWDGGMGTSWYNDPREEMITLLMTQRAWSSATPPPLVRDFWTLAYQAIDD
ncbi:MAG TPA: serine hydrolase domain-containing protein [Ktedonobacterales bacterium]